MTLTAMGVLAVPVKADFVAAVQAAYAGAALIVSGPAERITRRRP